MIALANRLKHIQPSATLKISAHANQLKAAGKDIINLTVGEPDFDTPENIKAAAVVALQEGFTKYTAVDGIKSLKNAIVEKLQRENELPYALDEVIVCCGAKQALYNLMQALLNPGDEVIIPAPYWVSYPEMVQLADAQPVFINADIDQRFKITAPQLAAAITEKTRMFIINSPSNPSGMAYSKEELKELSEVLLAHPQIIIASDDMYEHILWREKPFHNILNVCPELRDRTIVVNGVSKSYAMTGWRIGYAAGPKSIINAMTIIQSQSTSNPNSIAQVAAEAALNGNQESVREMCNSYHQRYEAFSAQLQMVPWLQHIPVDGTFYLFTKINFEVLNKILPDMNNDLDVATYLLHEIGVAVVPGSAFGLPGYFRFSFATSEKDLLDAARRLQGLI